MIKFVVVFLIVIAVVVGGLMSFRRSNRLGQPSQDVIERAKLRERDIAAKERADEDE